MLNEPEATTTRLGAYALCLDADDRLLLARCSAGEPEPGAWTLPGGGIEFGEHPDVAVLRELEEETGLRGRVDGVNAIWSHVLPAEITASGGPGHLVGIVYDVTVTGGELRNEVGGSTDLAQWLTLDEARAAPHVPIVAFCLDRC